MTHKEFNNYYDNDVIKMIILHLLQNIISDFEYLSLTDEY